MAPLSCPPKTKFPTVHFAKFIIGHFTFYASFESKILYILLCMPSDLKMTGTYCTDDARVKLHVPSFQKVIFFSTISNITQRRY